MAQRYPKLRTTGPGFETSGRNNFDHKLQFTFDYSDFDKKANEVNKELANFNRTIKDLFSQSGIKTSGPISMSAASKAYAGHEQGSKIGTSYDIIPGGAKIAELLKDELEAIGTEGADTMKKYVNRIDTGRMNERVTYKVTNSKNKSTVSIGWIGLWYKYFGFQENGTSRGIKPMHSIVRTYLEMVPKVTKGTIRLMKGLGSK